MIDSRFVRRMAIIASTGAVLGLSVPVFAQIVPSGSSTNMSMNGGAALSNTQVTPFTVKNVGGGTWEYGTYLGWVYKHVYSDYINNTYLHNATSIIGSDHDTSPWEVPGYWADSAAKGWPWQTAYVYWDND